MVSINTIESKCLDLWDIWVTEAYIIYIIIKEILHRSPTKQPEAPKHSPRDNRMGVDALGWLGKESTHLCGTTPKKGETTRKNG